MIIRHSLSLGESGLRCLTADSHLKFIFSSIVVSATKNKRSVSIALVLTAVLIVYSLHANLALAPSASPAGSPEHSATGPTHTTHPMVPVPPPPVTSDVVSSTATSSICPLSASQCLASYNWGGYAVCTYGCPGAAASGSVTEVQGTWTVPAIGGSYGGYGSFGSPGSQCSDPENTWYDNSDWIGIDGFSDGTVEQTGTSSDCYYGQAYYYAWYEFYPANSVTITSISVHPGNTMKAELNYLPNGLFTTTITDVSTHQSYTSPATGVPGAELGSAEWIAESAAYSICPSCIGFLALTQTNPVQFSDASATIGGVTHSISDWGSSVYWLLMVTLNFGTNQETGVATPSTETLANAKADPSALGRGGDSFNVDWLSSGP
jgi:hypothetical protein